MSGGHWDYLCFRMEETAESAKRSGLAFELLATIAHELEWGHSGDSCLDCARLRTVAALDVYFDGGAQEVMAARAVLNDHTQNVCERDAARIAASVRSR